MKVLYVVPTTAPSYGGPVQVVRNYLDKCSTRNIEVLLFPKNSKNNTIYLFPFLKGIKLTYFPGFKELFINLPKIIQKVDLIHINGLWSAPTSFASFFSRRLQYPYIISPHGMLDEWCLNQNKIGKTIHAWLFERNNLNKASAIHLFYEENINNVRNLGIKSPIFVLPNGVNLEDFNNLPGKSILESRYPELKNKIIMLFLGRIHYKKGINLLIPSLADAKHYIPDLHLVIAGPEEGNYKNEVLNLISKYSLEKSVTFTGFVDGELKRTVLGGADFFILPSYQEGDSVAIKEAMAAGLPVIITPYCHFREVMIKNAGIVIDTKIEDITNAIIRLCKHADLKKEMGINAKELIKQKYTWDKIVTKLIEIYEDILNRKFTSDCWRI